MIGTLRKHSAWLWAIIITLIIITFIFWGSASTRLNNLANSARNTHLGSLYNEAINQDDYVNARKEASLQYFFSNGEFPDRPGHQTSFDLDRETYFRLFLLKKAAELHVHIGENEVSEEARAILSSLGRNNEAVKIDTFEKQVLIPAGMTVEDFQRTVQNDLEIRQLYTLLGSSGGLVTPQEAQMLYIRDNTEVSAQAVFFSVSNYMADVTISVDLISQFYTNQAAYYRLPDRVQVTYVEYPITNYWELAGKNIADNTNINIDHQFDGYMAQNGTNYFQGAHDPVEARAKFHAAYHQQQAAILARKDANDFANELFDLKPTRADNLASLAKQKGLTVKTTEPFDSRNGPKDFDLPFQFTQAFNLSEDEPYSSAIVGEKAVYVIALDKQFPSEVPSLASIEPTVAADFTHYQATILARQATVRFYNTVTNALATGQGFSAACKEASVQPTLLPTFSMRSETNEPAIEAHVKFSTLKQAAFSILPGQAIYAGTDEGGMVLFVDSHLPINEARMNAELPMFLSRVRQSREQESFNFWFSHEASTAFKDVAALQPKPAAPQPH